MKLLLNKQEYDAWTKFLTTGIDCFKYERCSECPLNGIEICKIVNVLDRDTPVVQEEEKKA